MSVLKEAKFKLDFLYNLAWIVPIGSILWWAVATYYETDINEHTSAKPQAQQFDPYVEQSGGEILHTYNRNTGSQASRGSPDFEFYIEYPDSHLEYRAREVADALSGIGYKTKYTQFSVKDSFCTRSGYGSDNFLPNGQRATETAASRYCHDAIGVDDPHLFGATENDKQPYYTVYGEDRDRMVFIQISDRTFNITSNDFWRDEYMEKYGLDNETVRPGHSMMVVRFGRK